MKRKHYTAPVSTMLVMAAQDVITASNGENALGTDIVDEQSRNPDPFFDKTTIYPYPPFIK